MGIFKKLINKVLDAEVPPAVEQLVKKELIKKRDTEENPSDTSCFSMKIEDVFSIPRRGTVVTGEIDTGSIKLNDEITIVGENQKKNTKVVMIEKSNKLVNKAKNGDRVSLLLDKIKQDEVKNGYIVTNDENIGLVNISPQIAPVIYSEREIPDDSDEAKRIRAEQEKYKDETVAQRLKRSAKESRARMESVGLTMYIWETSGDERVKPACKKMDGKLCLWADPTVYSRDKGKTWIPRPEGAALTHPGEIDGCRCTATSYWDELVGEL